jgi:hypothetical protein
MYTERKVIKQLSKDTLSLCSTKSDNSIAVIIIIITTTIIIITAISGLIKEGVAVLAVLHILAPHALLQPFCSRDIHAQPSNTPQPVRGKQVTKQVLSSLPAFAVFC